MKLQLYHYEYKHVCTLTWSLIKSYVDFHGYVLSRIVSYFKGGYVVCTGEIFDGQKHQNTCNLRIITDRITMREPMVKNPPVAEDSYC